MQYLSKGVLTDYDAESGWFRVQDVARPAVAGYTPHAERVYDLVNALQADGKPEPTGVRDYGDEDPHADA